MSDIWRVLHIQNGFDGRYQLYAWQMSIGIVDFKLKLIRL